MFQGRKSEQMKGFYRFCKERKYLVFFTVLVSAIVYGSRIFSQTVTVDTDHFINIPEYMYNWLDIGRYGLILTEKIFGIRWYNPYINSTLAYFTIILFLLAFCYVFEVISDKKNSNNYYIFCAIFITHPIWPSQWMFKLQNFEIALSILMLAIALYMIFLWIEHGNILWTIPAILLLIWSFASYQTNVELFIAAGAVAVFLYKEKRLKQTFFVCLKVIVPFLIAFVGNQLIVKLFFSSSSYISGQILWGTVPVSQCIDNILTHFRQVLSLETNIFYGITYLVLFVLVLVFFMLNLTRVFKTCVWKWLAAFLVLLAPFLLTIIAGNIPTYRSQYVLGFSCAAGFMYLCSSEIRTGLLEKAEVLKKSLKLVLLVLAFGIVLNQTYVTLRMWYTDDVRYEQDVDFLNQVVTRINLEGYNLADYRIVFIGRKSPELNAACYGPNDVIGLSYFDMFVDVAPQYFNSSCKICDFADTRGIQMNKPTSEDVAYAASKAGTMAVWPAQGCIQSDGELLIIRLSDM